MLSRLLFLIKYLYLIDIWLGEDQITNTIKTLYLKEIELHVSNLINQLNPHSALDTSRKTLSMALSQNASKRVRPPGVEPGSIAWKAIILTVGLRTPLHGNHELCNSLYTRLFQVHVWLPQLVTAASQGLRKGMDLPNVKMLTIWSTFSSKKQTSKINGKVT